MFATAGFEIMLRGRGNPSYRGGRGRGRIPTDERYYHNKMIIAQHGQQKLIASDISGLSKSDYDKEIEEFKAWKSMQKQGNTPSSSNASPSYAKAGVEYHYTQNSDAQVILLLNEKDKKWAKEPQVLYTRYLNPHGYTMETYKTRIYYEQILANNGCEFAHFSNSGKAKEVYNFSKVLIQRVISIEDWGISPFTEKVLINNENGNTIKYNYWDYIQAFDKVFTYENPGFTHTWFIKIYSNIIDSFIPSWFINWWNFMGTRKEILPGEIRQYYNEFGIRAMVCCKVIN